MIISDFKNISSSILFDFALSLRDKDRAEESPHDIKLIQSMELLFYYVYARKRLLGIEANNMGWFWPYSAT